jgi:hypothetical protein
MSMSVRGAVVGAAALFLAAAARAADLSIEAEGKAASQPPVYADEAASGKRAVVFTFADKTAPATYRTNIVLAPGVYEASAWIKVRPTEDIPFKLCLQAGEGRKVDFSSAFTGAKGYLPFTLKLNHAGGPLSLTLSASTDPDFPKRWALKMKSAVAQAAEGQGAAAAFKLEAEPALASIKPYSPYVAFDRLTIRKLADLNRPVDWPRDLLVALSFDGSLESGTRSARARVEGKLEYKEGKFGQGLYVGRGTWLRLPLKEKSINRNEGTIGFWFKPDHAMADGKYRRLLSIGNEFSLHKDQFDCLSFHIGTKHVTTKEPSWKAGEWHHVAITWKNAEGEGDLCVYFDGDPYSTFLGRGRGFFTREMPADQLNIASFGVEDCQFDAVIDDVAVLGLALTQDDVRAYYGRGVSLKELLAGKKVERFQPVVNLALRQKATAQHPSQAYCDPGEFTDGEVKGWPYVTSQEEFWGKGPSWAQVDLGKVQKINVIRLWNYSRGTFNDVKIATSFTNKFEGEEFVVWDAAKNGTYEETPEGRVFVFPPQEARYVRCWNSGAIQDRTNKEYGKPFWSEIAVFYDETKERAGK